MILKTTMPKNKREYEMDLVNAYKAGLVDGYGIEHTDIENEERKSIKEYMKRYGFKYSYDELIKGEK